MKEVQERKLKEVERSLGEEVEDERRWKKMKEKQEESQELCRHSFLSFLLLLFFFLSHLRITVCCEPCIDSWNCESFWMKIKREKRDKEEDMRESPVLQWKNYGGHHEHIGAFVVWKYASAGAYSVGFWLKDEEKESNLSEGFFSEVQRQRVWVFRRDYFASRMKILKE